MSDSDLTAGEPKCPHCGGVAENGCLLGADKNVLQWFPGPADWTKNLESVFWRGKVIGKFEPLKGAYVEGVRCEACRRIVLSY